MMRWSLQNEIVYALTSDCPGSTIQADILFDGGLGGGNGMFPTSTPSLSSPSKLCSHQVYCDLLGSEFVSKLAEVYVKNTSATLSAVSEKLSEVAEDGKVSLAQALNVFETVEVGDLTPLIGLCGGEGTCQPVPACCLTRAATSCGWYVSERVVFSVGLGSGTNTAETVARSTARAMSEVTGSGNDAVDVEVAPMLERLIGTGPVRSAQLYTMEVGAGGAAGSGAAASKPALA